MAERNFAELSNWQRENQRQLCVGLDTNFNTLRTLHRDYLQLEDELKRYSSSLRTDADYVLAYNKMSIDATKDFAGAYKPNKASYEALGDEGFRVLRQTAEVAKAEAPQAMNILDAKIQDIDSTNEGYGLAYFDIMGFDAVTVHSYLGYEALEVLTQRKDKGFLVLGRTSNKGGGELQDAPVHLTRKRIKELMNGPATSFDADEPKVGDLEFYKYVTYRVANHWNINGNCGLVAGATYPVESGMIRKMVGPNLFLLIPGVGAQGGEAKDIVPEALRKGEAGVINSSRGITFAKRQEDESQFSAIRRASLKQHQEIVITQNIIA